VTTTKIKARVDSEFDLLLNRTLKEMSLNNEMLRTEDMAYFDLQGYIRDAAGYLHITDERIINDVQRELA
jgi:hypothetical protein